MRRAAIVAVPLWLTLAVLIFNTGPIIKLVVALVLGVTLLAPVQGLVLVAVLAPLGQLIAHFVIPNTFRIGEAVVVAFLAGWLLRRDPDRPGPNVPAPLIVTLFAVLVIASMAGVAWRLNAPGELARLAGDVYGSYYQMHDRLGLLNGARLLEGLGLAVAAVTLFRRHPAISVTLPAALAAAGVVAAGTSLFLWLGIGSAAALERQSQIGYRVSAHVADMNAAGSYFAMIACLGLGMALRASGRTRVLWSVATVGNLLGLWLSASRSATAAMWIVLAGGALWTWTARWTSRTRAAALLCLIVVALGLGALWARQLSDNLGYRGVGFRQQFNATSLRMIQASPVVGVGVGQYYPLSAMFFTPELAWTYGFENAHNYFLQVGAELGLLGLGLLSAWLIAAVMSTARALAIEPRDWRLLGGTAGALAFIGTSITGHPLLIDEVAYPFWMLFGLVVGLAGSVQLNHAAAAPSSSPAAAWWRTAALAGAGAAAAVLVATRVIEPPVSRQVHGFYELETGGDGMPFQWTGRYASLFVPSETRHVDVKIRMPTRPPALTPMGVEVNVAGNGLGRTIVADAWNTINLDLPELDPRAGFTRIDLKVDRTWQPALYIPGSADMREVGVQVAAPPPVR